MWKYAETVHHILYFLLLSLSNELLLCPLSTYQSLNDGTCNILILLLRVLDLKDLQLFSRYSRYYICQHICICWQYISEI